MDRFIFPGTARRVQVHVTFSAITKYYLIKYKFAVRWKPRNALVNKFLYDTAVCLYQGILSKRIHTYY